MPNTEIDCVLEIRDNRVWIHLRGALRASGAAALAALARAHPEAKPSQAAVADLSDLEVADALGMEALRLELSRFAQASVLLPPPWTQAAMLLRRGLPHVHLVEWAGDLHGQPSPHDGR